MSAIVDKAQHYRTIGKTCYTANIIYLIVHVIYLVLFIIAKMNVMIYVDAAIILIYLLFFLVLKKEKWYLYALLCGNEFFVFIIVSTIMLGFNSGFHLYLIGLCVVSFFTTYFSKNRNPKGSIAWVGLSLIIYLTLYFTSKYFPPYYVTPRWLEMTLFSIHSVAVFAFVASYLIVFLKYAFSLEKKIMIQSRTDELTQINNRYGLYDFFDQDDDKTSLALALFDIDDFKNINDSYGHVTGDYILKRVAQIASSTLSDSFVCRYGGEEFVIVLDNSGWTYFEKLEELRKNIEKETFEFEGIKIKITITIGAVNYMKDLSLEKWVELADKKMYVGKSSGKNKTVI